MAKKRIKKNDQVKIVCGKDKGKTASVLRIVGDKVFVEGANLMKKAVKKRRQEDQGGIIEIEAPIHISNVMVLTKSGKPSRVGFSFEKGSKKRIAVKSGDHLS